MTEGGNDLLMVNQIDNSLCFSLSVGALGQGELDIHIMWRRGNMANIMQ